MAQYEVIIKEIEIYRLDSVEAKTEEEAIEKAWELLAGDEGRGNYHDNSDGESEAIEI